MHHWTGFRETLMVKQWSEEALQLVEAAVVELRTLLRTLLSTLCSRYLIFSEELSATPTTERSTSSEDSYSDAGTNARAGHLR